MIKYLVSDTTGDHLPYTGMGGAPDHRLMGAAWAALHEGYRGKKYDGPGKQKALAKLKGLYKTEGMSMPQESWSPKHARANVGIAEDAGASMVGLLPTSDSLDSLKTQVQAALRDTVCACDPMSDSCECPDGGTCSCDDMWCWIQDIFADRVVYSLRGQLYSRTYSKATDGTIALGSPTPVEIAYKAIGESYREAFRESLTFQEASSAYDAKTGRLTFTVIESGLSKNKKFYPPATLRRDFKIFEGAKMFVNHQTDVEKRARPEGDVNGWAAQVERTWVEESDGKTKIKGTALVIDPPFKEKLSTLQQNNLLQEMGVSIRAIGSGQEADIPLAEGTGSVRAMAVDHFVACRSVDFVTFAGAGGRCEVLESDSSDEFDIELADAATLRERRPDLVELIESNARGEAERMKTTEQQLQEALAEIKTLSGRATAAETQLAEANKTAARAKAQTTLTKLLEKSKLPKMAAAKITKQFETAESDTGMQDAIDAEKQYIAAVGGGARVADLGESDNLVDDDDDELAEGEEFDESTETRPAVPQGKRRKNADFVAAFQESGLTEEEAKKAAKGLGA